jgi:hypothetical protein
MALSASLLPQAVSVSTMTRVRRIAIISLLRIEKVFMSRYLLPGGFIRTCAEARDLFCFVAVSIKDEMGEIMVKMWKFCGICDGWMEFVWLLRERRM